MFVWPQVSLKNIQYINAWICSRKKHSCYTANVYREWMFLMKLWLTLIDIGCIGCGDSACGTCCSKGVAAEQSNGGGNCELPNANSGDVQIRDNRLGSKDAGGDPWKSASSLTLLIFAAVADGSMVSRERSGSSTNAFMCSRLSATADGVATRPNGNPAGTVMLVSITVPWSLLSLLSVGTCTGSLQSQQLAAPEQCFVSLF